MKTHALRLSPGNDLKISILEFARDKKITAGLVLTCVGSLKTAQLRFADQTQAVIIDNKFEIVSLVGTFSAEAAHLHISLSDAKGGVIGGHLLNGCLIFTTAEIVIGEIEDLIFEREMDSATGFKELVIRKKQSRT